MGVYNISVTPIKIVSAGDPETLIVNKSTKYTVNIDNNNGVGVGNGLSITPLGPYESLVVNGEEDVWCIEAVAGQPCTVVTKTNALLWTPKAIQPNITDQGSPFQVFRAVGTHTFTLTTAPAGVQGVAILLANTGNFSSISVTGVTTGNIYGTYNPSSNTSSGQTWIPLPADAEPGGFQFSFVGTGGIGTAAVTIVWLMNNFAAGLVADGNAALVQLSNVTVNGGALLVSESNAQQDYPNQPSVAFNTTIAAAGDLTLVTGVVGQVVSLIQLTLNTTGDTYLEDSGSGNVHVATSAYSGPVPLHGQQLASGLGVKLHNPGGGAVTVKGSLVYSQN